MSKFKMGGPGIIIAAAFIGPGTVTICTLAGANHGLQLLWAVLLSIGLTIFLQEMSIRLSIVSRLDLVDLIKQEIQLPIIKSIVLFIILSAVVIGNGAYEAGNISGGALGINSFIDLSIGSINLTPILIGLIAFTILWYGTQKVLATSLTFLVILLSVGFIASAIMVQPNLGLLLSNIFVPHIPKDGFLLVLGVFGTTVVPYNLFLHASLAKQKWANETSLFEARRDTIIAISIGGIISMAIVISASTLEGQSINNAMDMAKGLEPIFGSFAKYLISLGLFSAGITSAITAPLAAAYVLTTGLGWNTSLKSWPFRLTWISVLFSGVLFSSIGYKPISIIHFAQITNGLILPIVAILLVWLCTKKSILKNHLNNRFTTLAGIFMVTLLLVLGFKSIWMVFR
ncbi:MAG: Nramp family divalent metal transporter [Reichenbachiella sp.]